MSKDSERNYKTGKVIMQIAKGDKKWVSSAEEDSSSCNLTKAGYYSGDNAFIRKNALLHGVSIFGYDNIVKNLNEILIKCDKRQTRLSKNINTDLQYLKKIFK